MPRCAIGRGCGGGEIKGKVYFLNGRPHCVEDAKPEFSPRIEQRLGDVFTLVNTFREAMPLLDKMGGVQMGEVETPEGRKTAAPVRSWGLIGRVSDSFQKGQDLYRVTAAASTLAGDARLYAAGYLVWATNRIYQASFRRLRDLAREQAIYALEQFLASFALRQKIREYHARKVFVPSDVRAAFLETSSNAFFNAIQAFKTLARAFRKEQMAARVGEQDALLIERTVGFNPADLVAKPEDEVDPDSGDKKKVEVPVAEEAPAGPPKDVESGGEERPEAAVEEVASPNPAIEAIVALRKKNRVVPELQTEKGRQKRQDQARKTLQEHGLDANWGGMWGEATLTGPALQTAVQKLNHRFREGEEEGE